MHATQSGFDLHQALEVIRALAQSRKAFTTDDAWVLLQEASDGRMIANALIRAERTGVIRNSQIGTYLRGRQAHRRWLSIWLSIPAGGTIDDAARLAAQLSSQEYR